MLQLSEKAVILYQKEYYFIFHCVLLNLGTNLNNERDEREKLQSTYK